MRKGSWLVAAALLALVFKGAVAAEPPRLAVFDIELINTSLEPTRPDEEQRLAMLNRRLREALARSGRFTLVDIEPVRARLAAGAAIHGCNGCELDAARTLGAALALTGIVQKVSNLILNINLYEKDVATGATLRGGSVDIRGNTDESWQHGLDWLLRNRILVP